MCVASGVRLTRWCTADYAFTVASVSVTGGGSVFFYGDALVATPDAVCLLGQEARQANVTPSIASCLAPPSSPCFARLRLSFNGLDADEDAFVDLLYRGASLANNSCTLTPTRRLTLHSHGPRATQSP